MFWNSDMTQSATIGQHTDSRRVVSTHGGRGTFPETPVVANKIYIYRNLNMYWPQNRLQFQHSIQGPQSWCYMEHNNLHVQKTHAPKPQFLAQHGPKGAWTTPRHPLSNGRARFHIRIVRWQNSALAMHTYTRYSNRHLVT